MSNCADSNTIIWQHLIEQALFQERKFIFYAFDLHLASQELTCAMPTDAGNALPECQYWEVALGTD